MTAGVQANPTRIDEDITNCVLAFREVCTQARNLNTQVNGAGNGTAYLSGIGYPDPTSALLLIGYLSNLAGVYFGTATVASDFNFDQGLAPAWGGQV
jgi:hypothetical protein